LRQPQPGKNEKNWKKKFELRMEKIVEEKIKLTMVQLRKRCAADAARRQLIQNQNNWLRIKTDNVTGDWLPPD